MPAGQIQLVTTNSSQILNPFGINQPPTLIENIPTTVSSFDIDLCWSPTFSETITYRLSPGDSYAWPSDIPLFVRISPDQTAGGLAEEIWVQPQGVGQSSSNTTTTISGPLPLPVNINTNAVPAAPNNSLNPLYVVPVAPVQQELIIPNPPVGQKEVFILPTDGKIKLFRGSLVCGAETNTRQLFFTIVYSPIGVMQYPFIIGETNQSCGFAGAIGTMNFALPAFLNFALPNIVLPAGSRISINVIGINPDDYLDELDFTISSV
jgi:hypothetical protein